MLEARALTKDYGALRAVDDLNLRVPAGHIVALLGANGAGKSTTTQMLLGFVRPSSGSAWVDGVDVAERPDITRRKIAYIPDRLALYPHLSARENLDYFQKIRGLSSSPDQLGDYLLRAGVPASHVDARVGSFSKGTRQKVGLALALAKSAKALLLDEPLSGLDPSAANDFCVRLRQVRDEGTAVLMATHDLFRARDTADTIVILRQGRLVHQLDAKSVTHAELDALYLEAAR